MKLRGKRLCVIGSCDCASLLLVALLDQPCATQGEYRERNRREPKSSPATDRRVRHRAPLAQSSAQGSK
jgi:hypothetical protein